MHMRRLVTTLAAAALLAVAGCTKEGGTADAGAGKHSVGAKIDRALDSTHDKLERAGEKAKQEIEDAAGKTQETLSRAGERISTTTSNAVNEAKQSLKGGEGGSAVPYSPRQPVQDKPAAPPAGAMPAATPAATPTATTEARSSGPATSAKSFSLSEEARAALGDAAITASIKADFLKDPDLSVLKIDVDTNDGVVTLNGLAETEAAKQRAERMAEAVKGVREVRNYLTIKRA